MTSSLEWVFFTEIPTWPRRLFQTITFGSRCFPFGFMTWKSSLCTETPQTLETRPRYTPVTQAKPTRNRPQTDKNHQIRGEIDKLSVVGRLYIGVVSVLSGSVRGRVGLNSATDGRWFVGLRSAMYRTYVGRPDTDSRPIQDRMKSDITSNCVELADTFPNQNRRVPDISRTQTECKPITVCGVIPT